MGTPNDGSNQQLIDSLVCRLNRWGLALPAMVFLEVARPLSFIASQGLLLCQPLLSFFYPEPRIAGYANLLANRENIDHLLARLEQDRSSSGSKGKEKG
jgi:hypothetical protein